MTSTIHGTMRPILYWSILLLCAIFLFPRATAAAMPLQPEMPQAGNLPFLPCLDYFLDGTGDMDVEEVAAPENAQAFHPLILQKLPRESAVMWLRFTLAPLPEKTRPTAVLLDMGESVPGALVLYAPVVNPVNGAPEWGETPIARRAAVLLPEAGKEPLTCFIRMEGLPGPWFSPALRTPQDAANKAWSDFSRTAAALALAVVMLLCLLRALTEKGQWRIWTALYVGAALAQSVAGMPAFGNDRPGLSEVAALLLPGIALMLLSHAGRHLLGGKSRALDIQFLLLSLSGTALAILPLLPWFSWTARYVDLWPAGTLLFAPSALGACIMGIPGGKRFLLACLLSALFTVAGVLCPAGGFSANLLAAAPLWGTALGAMLIATTTTLGDRGKSASTTSAGAATTSMTTRYDLGEPLDDPNLRLVPPQTGGAPLFGAPPAAAASDTLRIPLDRLMREGAALEHCALPPAVRQYVENMLDAAKEMRRIISATPQTAQQTDRTVFNLQQLMREVHDSTSSTAQTAGIGLAWYMPPHLGHTYEGEAEAISETLCLLLESAVRATQRGAVQFSVRRVPESADAGHLLFTVQDTGAGMPPQNRSSLALTRAWELAGVHNGFLGLECGPQGTTIAFTLHLKYLEMEGSELAWENLPHVIITAEGAVDRQLLAHMLKSLPCRSSEARSLHEALQIHQTNPALLLIAQGQFVNAAPSLLLQFTEQAKAASLPFCKFLAITKDDSHWDDMAHTGFTHALLEPVDSEAFCITVKEILHEAAADKMSAAKAVAPDELLELPQMSEKVATSTDSPVPGYNASPAQKSAATPVGRPPLPDLFSADAPPGETSSVKIPDLTALPDLLSFAESLRNNPPKGATDKGPAKQKGSLFGGFPDTEPLSLLDMSPKMDAGLRAARAVLSKTEKPAEAISPASQEQPAAPSPPEQTHPTATKPGLRLHLSSAAMPRPAQPPRIVPTNASTAGTQTQQQRTTTKTVEGVATAPAPGGTASFMDFIAGTTSASSRTQTVQGVSVPTTPTKADNTTSSPPGQPRAPLPSKPLPVTGQTAVTHADPVRHDAGQTQSSEPQDKPSRQRQTTDSTMLLLVEHLDRAIEEAQSAFAQRRAPMVGDAARRIAAESDNYGLRVLSRMARCVEQAARANDMNALGDLLPELVAAVERNRIALTPRK